MKPRHTTAQVLLHWVVLTECAVLAASGIALHSPRLSAPRGLEVFIHLAIGYVLLSTVALRIYWLVLGAPADWRTPLKAGRRDGWVSQSRYLIYLAVWSILAALVITGFALRFPTADVPSFVVHALGGMVGVRTTHYLLMWVFASALLVHSYQPLLHGSGRFLSIFAPDRRREPARKKPADDSARPGVSA